MKKSKTRQKSILGGTLFSKLLAEEYETRRKANPLFSRRAFARLLGVPPVTLSYMLDDSRKPSPRTLATIVKALGWSEEQRAQIMDGFASDKKLKLELDQKWHHEANPNSRLLDDPVTLAVRILSNVPNTPADPEILGAQLQVPPSRIAKALQILEEEALIQITNGFLLPLKTSPYFLPAPESKAIDYKRQVLEKLLTLKEARDGVEIHSLFFHLCLTPEQVERLGSRLIAFKRRLVSEFPAQSGGEVYYGLFAAFPFVDAVREKHREPQDLLKPRKQK